MDKRYQVFISSTYSDLKEERSKVMQTIMSLDCIPAGMELFPANDTDQFDFIKKIIDDCDYYILIVGGRYGTISDDGISYTEKEFDYAIDKKIPVLAFLHEDINNIPVGKSDIETIKREKLIAFREKVSSGRLVKFWNNAEDLNGKVAVSLNYTIKAQPGIGWIRANLQTNAEFLQEMNNLRKELAELKDYKVKTEQDKEKEKILVDQAIAGIDEEFTINGSTLNGSYKEKWTIHITWKDLFAKIAPDFISPQRDTYVRQIIIRALGYSTTRAFINSQDFQTIKIQFMVNELFEIKLLESTEGVKDLFWCLTDKGNRLMIETRTIKTAVQQ
jgi:hypothetical protein